MIVYKDLVDVVFEEIAAEVATVSIVDSEKLGFDSVLLDVEGDADTIFVVIASDALVGVDCVSFYYSVLFYGSTGLLEFGD